MYNLSEVTTLLINYFVENTTFALEKDFNKIIKITTDEEVEKAIVKAGLERLVEEKILVKLSDTLFLLDKPLAKYPQTVEIPFPITLTIANTINAVCQDLKDEVNIADPLCITANDIANLLNIIHNLEKYGTAAGKQ